MTIGEDLRDYAAEVRPKGDPIRTSGKHYSALEVMAALHDTMSQILTDYVDRVAVDGPDSPPVSVLVFKRGPGKWTARRVTS